MATHIESPTTTPSYTYSTSGAQSTRHIIDTSTKPNEPPSHAPPSSPQDTSVPFRPTVFKRQSTNYAAADAQARQSQNAARAEAGEQLDGVAEVAQKEAEVGHKTIGWKPRMGRTQSWSQQDMKHLMHMSGLKEGAGFSEAGKGEAKR